MRRILPILFFVIVSFFVPSRVYATIGCEIGVSPDTLPENSSSQVSVTLSNTGDENLNWMRLWSGNAEVWDIQGVSSTGWVYSEAVLNSGSVAAGSNITILLGITAQVSGEVTDLHIEVSGDSGGSTVECGNAPSITVVAGAPVAPQISNINLTVGNSSAILTWNTDMAATGVVNYGITSGYGSNSVTGSGTSHSVTLSSLSASTTYHYQITVTGEGGNRSTADANFVTSAANVTTTTTTTVTNTVTNTVTKIITDTTPPSVNIKTLDKKIYESTPILSGSALDDRGVARVEYQVVGKDTVWISMGLNETVGSKKVTWEALPSISLDGTYKIKVRAVDVFGNIGVVKTIDFVIDQLPPTVGGGVIFVGALPIGENSGGVIEAMEGVEYELVLFENGGADKLNFEIEEQKYEFKKIGNGLWRGSLKLKAGDWVAKVTAVDGAENKTERVWGKFLVKPAGEIMMKGKILSSGKVRVMWMDPTMKIFKPWEGADYGQLSEKNLDAGGVLNWILPKGEYYLELALENRKIVSQKIVVEKILNLTGNWDLSEASGGSFGKFKELVSKVLGSIGWKNSVRFNYLAETVMSSENMRGSLKLEAARDLWIGKANYVLVTSPDLPWSGESYRKADEMAKESQHGLVVVGLQKSQADLEKWVNNKQVKTLADPKGEWLVKMNIGVLPQLYQVDSRGEVIYKKVGVER